MNTHERPAATRRGRCRTSSRRVSGRTQCTIVADLGERAMVGANSVVLRPVPAFTVVGGVPARELEYFGPAREG